MQDLEILIKTESLTFRSNDKWFRLELCFDQFQSTRWSFISSKTLFGFGFLEKKNVLESSRMRNDPFERVSVLLNNENISSHTSKAVQIPR